MDYKYVIVTIFFFYMFFTVGYSRSASMFISDMINDIKMPDGSNIEYRNFGMGVAIGQFFTALCAPVHVFLANKYGTKTVAFVCMAVLFPLKFYNWTGKLPHYYLLVVTDGIASIFFWGLFVIGPIEVNKWFPIEKRPFPNAIIYSGAGIGSLVFTMLGYKVLLFTC